MHGAFGEDQNVGNYMMSNNTPNVNFLLTRPVASRSDSTDIYQSLAKTSVPGARQGHMSVKSYTTQQTGIGIGDLTEQLGNWGYTRRLELFSAILSFICLCVGIGIFARNYPLNISLTRNLDFISRDSTTTTQMRLWHSTADASCGTNKNFELMLLKAPWRSSSAKTFDGFIIESSVKVSEIELCSLALFIYLFSTSFQGARVYFFDTLCAPERGPEFSRWLEYAFTSPLQILLVALAFRITNLDVLLGYFGMQLAMVIMGYEIERQIKKKYKRSYEDSTKEKERFYQILKDLGCGDIRGWVYLVITWALHLLIWGVPGLWNTNAVQWGISGDYAFSRKYQSACFKDVEFQMPDAVDFIFWSQYLLFTVFGLVCSFQFLKAYIRPVKNAEDAGKRWTSAAWRYSLLSISAKTILEVGFLMLLSTGAQWLEFEKAPKDSVATYNVTKLVMGSTTVFANTTCFAIA